MSVLTLGYIHLLLRREEEVGNSGLLTHSLFYLLSEVSETLPPPPYPDSYSLHHVFAQLPCMSLY